MPNPFNINVTELLDKPEKLLVLIVSEIGDIKSNLSEQEKSINRITEDIRLLQAKIIENQVLTENEAKQIMGDLNELKSFKITSEAKEEIMKDNKARILSKWALILSIIGTISAIALGIISLLI